MSGYYLASVHQGEDRVAPGRTTPRPGARPGLIRRDRLLSRFASVPAETRFVLVTAPPGSGKTIALNQWAETDARPFAWVQLTGSHNDPAWLLRDILFQLALSQPLGMDTLWRRLNARRGMTDVALWTVLSSLSSVEKPTVLVLDDLHHIHHTAALDLIASLAARLPRGWLLVAASQRQPPNRLRLGRLRSAGKVVEFGPAELAFSPGETRQLLGGLDIELPDKAVRAIVAHTEGWPAGVYLAALSIAGRPDPVTAANEITGGNRYIVDYFRQEILTRQSPGTVRFMLRTSVLDELCGPLCDAVLDASGSATRLTKIQAQNLFIVPLDDRGEWYRYHRLFAEMLQSQLRRQEPDEERFVLARASSWFEGQGMPEPAINYALAAGDMAAGARLIATHVQRFHSEGRIWSVRAWLDALDERSLRAHPPLAVTAAGTFGLTGNAPRALRSLRIAESATFDGPLPDGSSSLASAVARTRAALTPFGVDEMIVDAKLALDEEPPGSTWHTAAAGLYGIACMLKGANEEAAQAFERTARLSSETTWPEASAALGERALLAAGNDDWAAAGAYAAESRSLIKAGGLEGSVTSLPAYLASAMVALHAGKTRVARENAESALRLYRQPSPVAFPWLATQAAILLGSIQLELGDEPGAEDRAADAARYLSLLTTEGVLREQLQRLCDDIELARERSRPEGTAGLTKAELRILRLLPTYLSLGEIAEELILSRNTVKSQVAAIYRKLDAGNRAQAVRKAHELRLLEHRE